MFERLVSTTAFGKPKFAEMALGLARSLAFIGDKTPRAILTDIEGVDWERHFDVVIRKKISKEETYWASLFAIDHVPAKRHLILDADCLAFKRLGPIFDAFDGCGYGVQGIRITEGEWYGKDIADLCREQGIESLPKFNSGLIYVEPGQDAQAIMDQAARNRDNYFEIGYKTKRSGIPDEPCFALAMAQTRLGRVVHDSENFQNSGVGLVGKFRMNVAKGECNYLCRRYDLQYVEPYLIHVHFWAHFLIYWRQLKRLEKLEKFGDEVSVNYRPPFYSLKRSLQKRYMKAFWGVE